MVSSVIDDPRHHGEAGRLSHDSRVRNRLEEDLICWRRDSNSVSLRFACSTCRESLVQRGVRRRDLEKRKDS